MYMTELKLTNFKITSSSYFKEEIKAFKIVFKIT